MLTEWEGPAVVIGARPYGESGLVVTLMTEALGRHPGMARGGQSRAQAPLWQPGNLVEARWVARLSDQLGAVTGEMVHAAAALAMDDPLALAVLTAACAVAEGALPERHPHPATFHGLVGLVVALARDPHRGVEALIRWEAALLAELGYGLDLTSCAATGVTDGLTWVSPRTGRAVSAAAGAPYAERLLPLPALMTDDAPASPAQWQDGLRLTAHFLERDAFGHLHRPLPTARQRLSERVAAMV